MLTFNRGKTGIVKRSLTIISKK